MGSVEASLPDVLALGVEVEVRSPPALRSAVAEAARAIAARHAGDG